MKKPLESTCEPKSNERVSCHVGSIVVTLDEYKYEVILFIMFIHLVWRFSPLVSAIVLGFILVKG